ncbi:SNF1-related protein kinase regulatory subunit gamma-like [Nymphaea thermarum]|nr:SNF1-related protein kinase regulatory subunit gamma-like [Nymphaea thermarum]
MQKATKEVRTATVRDLVAVKRRLVEVPYTASLTDTVNAMVANSVVAVPVAAPPGQWIGAGGTMIIEHDQATGEARKQYIGMVSMLDVLAYVADQHDGEHLADLMSVPVSTVIGHCLEGLSLWTFNPNTSVVDCMEAFSKGIHRALVPLTSCTDEVIGVELSESSAGYQMLTQMDVLSFLDNHRTEIDGIMSLSITELGAVQENVFAVPGHMKAMEAVKCMRSASLNAVPIIEAPKTTYTAPDLINGKGMKLIGTFSATDLRGCPVSLLQPWLSLSVIEFTAKVPMGTRVGCGAETVSSPKWRPLVTCYAESSLKEVISLAVDHHVHRVWVVDKFGLLVGLVALTDMLRVIRSFLLSADS